MQFIIPKVLKWIKFTIKTSCDYIYGFCRLNNCTNFQPTCMSSNNFLVVLGCQAEPSSIYWKKTNFHMSDKNNYATVCLQHRGWIKKNYAFHCKVGTTAITERHVHSKLSWWSCLKIIPTWAQLYNDCREMFFAKSYTMPHFERWYVMFLWVKVSSTWTSIRRNKCG